MISNVNILSSYYKKKNVGRAASSEITKRIICKSTSGVFHTSDSTISQEKIKKS